MDNLYKLSLGISISALRCISEMDGLDSEMVSDPRYPYSWTESDRDEAINFTYGEHSAQLHIHTMKKKITVSFGAKSRTFSTRQLRPACDWTSELVCNHVIPYLKALSDSACDLD